MRYVWVYRLGDHLGRRSKRNGWKENVARENLGEQKFRVSFFNFSVKFQGWLASSIESSRASRKKVKF